MTRPEPTPEIIAAVAQQVRAGAPRDVAARVAGIGTSTLKLWLSQARAARDGATPDDPCPRCGAAGTDPCTTRNGRRAPATHTGRHPTNPDRAGPLLELLDAVEQAEAKAHAESIQLIRRAARDGTWQAAAWFLERRYPELYGRTVRTEVSGPEGGPVKLESTGLAEGVSTERLIELARRFDDTGDAESGDD